MKTRVPEVLHILAQRFAADYAAKYGMPELAQATFTHQREQNELPKVKAECFIQPTGQMAALVTRIEAETEQLNKLKSIKSGLSSDLLTGRVRTPEGASVC